MGTRIPTVFTAGSRYTKHPPFCDDSRVDDSVGSLLHTETLNLGSKFAGGLS